MKKGTLKQNCVHLQDHEYQTVKLLLELGNDIELIPPSQIKNYRVPDMMMNGVSWEIKAPEGSSSKTIKHNIQNAAHQASNIIVDLRRCKFDDAQALKELERQYRLTKRIRKLKAITKDEKIIDFSK